MYKIDVALIKKDITFFIEETQQDDYLIGISTQKNPIKVQKDDLLEEVGEYESVDEAICYLSHYISIFENTLSTLFLKPYYDLIKNKNKVFSYKEIAKQFLNQPSNIEELAVFQKLLIDNTYFKHYQKGLFKPYLLEDIREKWNDPFLSLNSSKKSIKQELAEVFQGILNKNRGKLNENEKKYFCSILDPLVNWVIFQSNSDYEKESKDLCDYFAPYYKDLKKKYNRDYYAFQFLKILGVFQEYDNLLLKRYDLDTLFEQQDESYHDLLDEHKDIFNNQLIKEKKDLTSLYTLTIDGEETEDYDDAISFIKMDNGFKVLIHISDVASRIPTGSSLDITAEKRTRTLYLPDRILNMFPEELTYHVLALKKDKLTPVITYCIKLDEHYNIMDYDIFESLIKVDENLSYKEVDSILEDQNHPKYRFFNDLLQASLVLQKQRIELSGGVEFLFSQISPLVNKENNDIYLKIYDTLNSKSSFIIKELMILSNYLTALKCYENDVDLLFFNQEAPQETIEYESRYISDKTELLDKVKHIKRSYLDIDNIGHYSLGLKCYTQSTSPIRRYLDLVAQRQLKSFLSHKDYLYNKEDLSLLKTRIYLQQKNFQLIENETNKFFLLNFLLKYHINNIIYGMVIKSLSDKEYLVELDLTKNVVKVESIEKLEILTRVSVKLHTIIPRLGVGLGSVIECFG